MDIMIELEEIEVCWRTPTNQWNPRSGTSDSMFSSSEKDELNDEEGTPEQVNLFVVNQDDKLCMNIIKQESNIHEPKINWKEEAEPITNSPLTSSVSPKNSREEDQTLSDDILSTIIDKNLRVSKRASKNSGRQDIFYKKLVRSFRKVYANEYKKYNIRMVRERFVNVRFRRVLRAAEKLLCKYISKKDNNENLGHYLVGILKLKDINDQVCDPRVLQAVDQYLDCARWFSKRKFRDLMGEKYFTILFQAAIENNLLEVSNSQVLEYLHK